MSGCSPCAALILTAGALLAAAAAAGAAQTEHPSDFWREIRAHDFALPAGASAFALIEELAPYLASPDPELRDELAYEIPAAWIYRDRRLAGEELKELLAAWRANLRRGIGESGTDSVLLRSFSALDLSLLAALDLERPFLEPGELEALLGSALDYLAGEKDVRGFEPRVGWIHATAHTADLLKFLGRNASLRPADPVRILNAIAAKLEAVREPFTHGEPERLARAVLSLAVRQDARQAALEAFVETLHARVAAMWRRSSRPDPGAYAAAQNGRELMQSLTVLLDQQPSLQPPAQALRAKLLAALH